MLNLLAEAIKAGRNVLVDKPLCLNAEEGEEILKAHQEHPNQVPLPSLLSARHRTFRSPLPACFMKQS